MWYVHLGLNWSQTKFGLGLNLSQTEFGFQLHTAVVFCMQYFNYLCNCRLIQIIIQSHFNKMINITMSMKKHN